MIFGVSGKMGSGKNFISEKIFIPLFEKKFPNRRILSVAFADQLKIKCIVKYGLNKNDVYNIKPFNVRKILQREGTENGRQKYGEDVWIKYLSEWIHIYSQRGITDFIVTDCRFTNEVNWIKSQQGKVIRIETNNTSQNIYAQESIESRNHVSETELDSYNDWDLIIQNDFQQTEPIKQKLDIFLNEIDFQ